MVRKTITQLTGVDTEYSRQFVDDGPLPLAPVEQAPKPASEATPKDAPQGKPKSARKPKPSGKRTAPVKAETAKKETAHRMVKLTLVPLAAHLPELEGLASHGVAAVDAIKVAGRRAVARFEPDASFDGSSDADRLPFSYAFRTNKAIETSILDKLRAEVDPLGLKGEGSLIRGQVEPLFWEELDAVILELKSRFANEKS